MNRTFLLRAAVVVTSLTLSCASFAAEDKDKISDFLADISPGSVSAAEMLGLPATAVTTIQAPKDFAVFIGGLNSDKAKQGMGVSITPGRTRLAPVSITDYSNNTAARIWAGTTFSYAQNRPTYGDVEYRQDAVALHGSFYLDSKDDPAVARYHAFASCDQVKQALWSATQKENEMTEAARKEILQKQLDLGKSDLEARDIAAMQAPLIVHPRTEEFRREMRETATKAAAKCVDDVTAEKWNASQLAYMIGAGWVRGTGASDLRVSLGRNLSLSAALKTGDNGLTNLTLKRTSRAVDTDTLATTPVYKSSTLAAARWTYGHGDKAGLFVLAEISNAKASRATVDNQVFKAALGIDKRIFAGGWLEFRVGRKRSVDSDKDETVALMNFKLSPSALLPTLAQ